MLRIALTACFPLCLVSGAALGQTRKGLQPAPELQSLTKALAGRWATTYVFARPTPTPADSIGQGEEVWRAGPGSLTLLEEEHIVTASRDQYLLAIQWWDGRTHALRGMLCNNAGGTACDVDSYANATLAWDGKQFVVDFRFTQDGRTMVWHEAWSDITPTSFVQTGDVGALGGTLTRVMTIHATRVSQTEKD